MAVIICGSGSDKFPKFGGREVFIGEGKRRDGIRVSENALFSGEDWK